MNQLKKLLLFLVISTLLPTCSRDLAGSRRNINDLKNCALLVRLNDLSDKAEKLEQAGSHKKSDYIRKYQEEKNHSILNIFNTHFDFSPVYYFLSSDTESPKSGNIEGIFLNNELKKDSDIKLDCSNYLIADFGIIDPDSNTDLANKWIIKGREYQQLKKPFPYHVKFIDCLFAGGLENEIKCLNKKLHSYYNKVSK